jgi:hypothetical protein
LHLAAIKFTSDEALVERVLIVIPLRADCVQPVDEAISDWESWET